MGDGEPVYRDRAQFWAALAILPKNQVDVRLRLKLGKNVGDVFDVNPKCKRSKKMKSHKERLDAAHRRIAQLAVNLTRLFSPIEVAGIFCGTAIAISRPPAAELRRRSM